MVRHAAGPRPQRLFACGLVCAAGALVRWVVRPVAYKCVHVSVLIDQHLIAVEGGLLVSERHSAHSRSAWLKVFLTGIRGSR